MIIKNQDDWWTLFLNIRFDVEKCFGLTGTAGRIPELDEAVLSRDGRRAASIINECWLAAPDHPVIHTWPHWGDICDLCSECWVFYEEAGA